MKNWKIFILSVPISRQHVSIRKFRLSLGMHLIASRRILILIKY